MTRSIIEGSFLTTTDLGIGMEDVSSLILVILLVRDLICSSFSLFCAMILVSNSFCCFSRAELDEESEDLDDLEDFELFVDRLDFE